MSTPTLPPTPLATRPPNRTLVSVEGNIGIGKSTLLNKLRKKYANDERVVFVDEPVGVWEEYGLLEAMYTGKIGRCPFQLMALTTRFASLLAALANPEATLIITERSIFSDKSCFAKVNLDAPADQAAYLASHEALCGALPDDLKQATIYLAAPLNVIEARIAKRDRAAEAKKQQQATTTSGSGDEEMETETDAPAEAEADGEGTCVGDFIHYLRTLDEAHVAYYNSLDAGVKRKVDAAGTAAEVAEAVFAAIAELEGPSVHSPMSVMAM